MENVFGQPAHRANDASTRGWQGGRKRLDIGRHVQLAISARPRLAHQHDALVSVQIREARAILPPDATLPAHDPGPTGTACPRRAFIRQAQHLTETGLENRFVVAALEGKLTVLALDGYFHARRKTVGSIQLLLKKSSSMSSSASNS